MKNILIQEHINESRGIKKASLVLKNARLVNVLSDEVKKCDIAVSDGIIVGIGNYFRGNNQIDMKGKFVCPGFIDTYTRTEDSMVSLEEFDNEVTSLGTTTYIADLQRIMDILGLKGADYYLKKSNELKANIYFIGDITKYLDTNKIIGFGELTNYLSLLNLDKDSLKKVLYDKKNIQGYLSGLSDEDLQVLMLLGISVINGCTSFEQALNVIRLGGTVLLKESSYRKNTMNIIRGAVQNFLTTDRFVFCSESKNIFDINKNGHINFNIKKAITSGLNPIYAVKIATLNAARLYGLNHLGFIAPGKQADMVVLNDLTSVDIDSVYIKGQLIKKENSIVKETLHQLKNYDSINKKILTRFDLQLKVSEGKTYVVRILNDSITTFYERKSVEVESGCFMQDNKINKIAVIDREFQNIGTAALENFGITNGAVASSISEQNNITIIGDNDEDMIIALYRLQELSGGIVIVSNGKVIFEIELPIMGLISYYTAEEISLKIEITVNILHNMGMNKILNPLSVLNYISSPLIPKVRVMPKGIFDVFNSRYL